MNYNSTGYIEFRTLLANGALPASDVNIRITGSEEGNIGIDYSIVTDKDGISEVLSLPAPSRSYSLSPNGAEQAFANYDVEVFKDGYYAKTITNVSIFDGIKSVLPIELIPNAKNDHLLTPNDNTVILTENEDLS